MGMVVNMYSMEAFNSGVNFSGCSNILSVASDPDEPRSSINNGLK